MERRRRRRPVRARQRVRHDSGHVLIFLAARLCLRSVDEDDAAGLAAPDDERIARPRREGAVEIVDELQMKLLAVWRQRLAHLRVAEDDEAPRRRRGVHRFEESQRLGRGKRGGVEREDRRVDRPGGVVGQAQRAVESDAPRGTRVRDEMRGRRRHLGRVEVEHARRRDLVQHPARRRRRELRQRARQDRIDARAERGVGAVAERIDHDDRGQPAEIGRCGGGARGVGEIRGQCVAQLRVAAHHRRAEVAENRRRELRLRRERLRERLRGDARQQRARERLRGVRRRPAR